MREPGRAIRPGRPPTEFSTGAADRALIALSQPNEVRYWSKKFNITPAKLKAAVGHSSKNVAAYLAKKKTAKEDGQESR